MSEIGPALLHVGDARSALSRTIWHADQLEDALNSAEFFIAKARAAMPKAMDAYSLPSRGIRA
jgi:hypothetical protein